MVQAIKRKKRWLVAGAGALTACVLLAGAGLYVLGHAAPAPFALVGTRPSASLGPTPQNSAELAQVRAFCAEQAPPNELNRCLAGTSAYKSACGSLQASSASAPAGTWLMATGSAAGFRVHERFLQVQLPNEAVGRTDHVAGGLTITGSTGALRITRACVAVSTLSLRSVDEVPGFTTSNRDGVIPGVLDGLDNPAAIFRAEDVALPTNATEGQRQTIHVSGNFSIHGVTKGVVASMEGIMQSGQLEVVGSFPITLEDYGMAPPENRMAAVDSTVTIEFHLYLDRR